ncbi:MAG: hypothetical protein ACP5KK_03050, partial [Candidatus Nanoarchaeia archaeon]
NNNTIVNLSIGSANVSFTGVNIGLKGVSAPPGDPDGYRNISKYVNATYTSETGEGSWLFLNVSYNDSDLNGIDESTLHISKYNDSGWETNCSVFAENCRVDTANNIVYANITNFGSIFAPLGSSGLVPVTCNLTVLINGSQVSNFTNAGEPYNVTVNVTNSSGSPVDANVTIIEENGYSIFVMPQFAQSNISVAMIGKTTTGLDGIVSFTAVPTGGEGINTNAIGNYNITVSADLGGQICNSTTLQVTYPNLPEPTGKRSPPNLANVRYFKDKVAIAYLRVKDWLVAGGGEIINLTIWTNKTIEGTLPSSFKAGKPYGFNITVKNSTTNGPVPDINVTFIEQNGFPPFILPQFSESNVSNFAVGYGKTDSNGNIQVTIVPTGGVGIDTNAIGNYSMELRLEELNISIKLNCTGDDCNFPDVSGSGSIIPNQENIRWFKDKIAIVYLRIKEWLS